MEIKKRSLILVLLFISLVGFSQSDVENSDIEKILNVHLINKLNQSKKSKIFFEIISNEELLRIINKSSKLKIFFALDEINELKIKVTKKRSFHKCNIETDSIFLFNKNRDFTTVINGKLKPMNSSKTYKVSLPVLIKEEKYSVFCSYSPYGPIGLSIFKKDDNGNWHSYAGEVFWD